MAINLKYVQKALTKCLETELGYSGFKVELTKDGVTAKGTVTFKKLNDKSAFVSILVLKNGVLGIDFVFDKLKPVGNSAGASASAVLSAMEANINRHKLINAFNVGARYFTGYIRDDYYFVVRYNVLSLENKGVAVGVKNAFNRLTGFNNLLPPILNLTRP